jgi:hypothetical protein
LCTKNGATLGCNSKKCHFNFHFSCGVAGEMAFLPDKRTFCRHCASLRGIPLGFPQELNQKRRIYMVKNTVCCNSISELNEVPFERWKPFLYDSFNRIGNLIILRINSKLEQSIKIQNSTTQINSQYFHRGLFQKMPLYSLSSKFNVFINN